MSRCVSSLARETMYRGNGFCGNKMTIEYFPAMAVLSEELTRQTRLAELWKTLDRNRVECYACGHRCPISPGFSGVCKVRFNRDGKLYAPWGYVNGLCCDPIEKKPFFHVLPGAH